MESGCITEDADDATDGFQIALSVSNPNGNCDEARVSISGEGLDAPVETEAIPLVDGSATVTVTLAADGNIEGAFEAIASVASESGDLSTDSDALSFTVDTVAPEVAITQPGASILFSDNDESEEEGFQVTFGGDVTGLAEGASNSVELLVNKGYLRYDNGIARRELCIRPNHTGIGWKLRGDCQGAG